MSKRKIFGELMEGVAGLKSHREAEITLRTYKSRTGTTPQGRFEVTSGHAQKAALFTSCFRSQAAD
jgi:hypothetical protein